MVPRSRGGDGRVSLWLRHGGNQRRRAADTVRLVSVVKELEGYACRAPCCAKHIDALARLGVAVDGIINDYGLDSVAVRCWDEFQTEWCILPCVIMSMLNDGLFNYMAENGYTSNFFDWFVFATEFLV